MVKVFSLANRFVNTGVGQVVANRIAVLASGLGIALLTPAILAPSEQGYFFTFLSLASLQGLFELGITPLLIQHFAHLHGGIGDEQKNAESRMRTLGVLTFAAAYFNKAALLFATLVGCGGAFFFVYSQGTGSIGLWLGPWIALTVATTLSIRNLSAFCALEGSGSLQKAYAIRTRSVILLFLFFAAGILLSAGLYAHPVALLVANAYCALKLRRELTHLRIGHDAQVPLEPSVLQGLRSNQRKFAVSAVAGFITASSITPYTFHFFGPVVAGQVGLSLSMFLAGASLAMAFSTADAPVYGQLIAQGRTGEVLRAWRKNIAYSLLCAGAMSGILLALHFCISVFFPAYISKVLGWQAFLFLGIMIVANTSLTTVSTVLRSFKTEVLMWPSIIAALVSLWLQFGVYASPAHYFLGMAAYNGGIFLPYAAYLMMRRLQAPMPVLVSR
jgi:hypothetical protein